MVLIVRKTGLWKCYDACRDAAMRDLVMGDFIEDISNRGFVLEHKGLIIVTVFKGYAFIFVMLLPDRSSSLFPFCLSNVAPMLASKRHSDLLG